MKKLIITTAFVLAMFGTAWASNYILLEIIGVFDSAPAVASDVGIGNPAGVGIGNPAAVGIGVP